MTIPLFQVDSFTEQPFRGNPAGVCLLESEERDAEWMQNVATEMNLSETAFLKPRSESGYDLRWFTPVAEVDLCGHATLASAHILWTTGACATDRAIEFETRSGKLITRLTDEGIQMDFPTQASEPAQPPEGLVESLGFSPLCVQRNATDYLLEIQDEKSLLNVEPNFSQLKKVEARGVIVTAPSDREGVDFVSRFFAPAHDIDEDPVTGSAHCCLAPFWSKRFERSELTGYQASARGGLVRVVDQGDRILLTGKAVTVFRGELLA